MSRVYRTGRQWTVVASVADGGAGVSAQDECMSTYNWAAGWLRTVSAAAVAASLWLSMTNAVVVYAERRSSLDTVSVGRPLPARLCGCAPSLPVSWCIYAYYGRRDGRRPGSCHTQFRIPYIGILNDHLTRRSRISGQ